MFDKLINNPDIAIAVIDGLFNVLTALVPSLVAYAWVRNQRFIKRLLTALKDIQFLLAVIDEYGEEMKLRTGQSHNNIMRERVRNFTQMDWSGENTNSRIRKQLKDLE